MMLNWTQSERMFLAHESFALFALYYFRHYFTIALADFHYDLMQDFEDLINWKIKESLWIAFRESGKTSLAKIGLAWMICNEKKKYINVDSFATENSERLLFDTAFELLNNKLLIQDYGILFSRKKIADEIKQSRLNNFICENGCRTRVEAHSTQESVRWRLHLNQRPDFLLIDDFENNKTKESEAYTKQIREHITEAMAGMSSDGGIIYLANYITEYWNIQFLLDRAKNDTNIRVRNIPVASAGKPTWPAKYVMTDEEAKDTDKVSIESKERQLGPQVFSYEMMNQPIDDSIAEFKKEWIQRAEESEIMHLNFNTFITIDSAVSEKDSADSTGIVINRVSSEGKWYITAYKLKVNPAKLIEHMFYLNDKYSPTMMWLEETTFTIAIRPFLEAEMAKRDEFFIVTPLKHWGTKKETRIRSLIPRYSNKWIFHIWNCNDLELEQRVFPRGANDDVLDALAYQEQIFYTPNSSRDVDNNMIEVKNYLTWEIELKTAAQLQKTYQFS